MDWSCTSETMHTHLDPYRPYIFCPTPKSGPQQREDIVHGTSLFDISDVTPEHSWKAGFLTRVTK